MYIIFLTAAIIIGGYFAFRYIGLCYAFRKIKEELETVQKDLTQNQILHMPVPNRHLAELLSSFNDTLEGIQTERQKYEKREKEFQRQIENISHDLRTPLTVILGYLRLMKKTDYSALKEQKGMPKELVENLKIIEHKAEVMSTLVTQFYEFSRLNAGDYKITAEELDIVRTLRESIVGNYQAFGQEQLNVETALPRHPVWVLGDKAALERIFLNLIQNAGRYADSYLRIGVREEKKGVVVFFENDTKKLAEEDVTHLFERFYMQDNSRNQGGTGLGLTVAKALAEEMGGEMQVRAEKKTEGEEALVVCFELYMK